MKIYTDTPEGTTVIQNSFIDRYMPHANGEFVKVYLYLLRCAGSGRELSLSSIADVFEHTEKDIHRAILYWQKQGLLTAVFSKTEEIESITFSTPPAETAPAAHKAVKPSSAGRPAAAGSPGPPVSNGISERISTATVKEQQDLKQLFFIAEQYLQRPLTSSEQSDFIYYYDTLHFSADLIEYLLEYCISKGSGSRHYMRKVALAWAEAGITTVRQAKQESNLYNRNYFTIMNSFGIKGRNPADAEQKLMSRWLEEFDFPIEIVLEACRRTILQTHQPNFSYADRILEQWHKSGVKSLSDIEKLDIRRMQEQKKAAAKQPQKSQNNRFNNFSQREYNYSQLEKQLLNQ